MALSEAVLEYLVSREHGVVSMVQQERVLFAHDFSFDFSQLHLLLGCRLYNFCSCGRLLLDFMHVSSWSMGHALHGQPRWLLFLHLVFRLHDVACKAFLHKFGDQLAILAVAVANSEIPQVLHFRKVPHYEEVVLISLGLIIFFLASPRHICKVRHQIFL